VNPQPAKAVDRHIKVRLSSHLIRSPGQCISLSAGRADDGTWSEALSLSKAVRPGHVPDTEILGHVLRCGSTLVRRFKGPTYVDAARRPARREELADGGGRQNMGV
jgi:hypothetical protein